MLQQYKTVFAYMKGAFVGVMNEQFNSINMDTINNVKKKKNSHTSSVRITIRPSILGES